MKGAGKSMGSRIRTSHFFVYGMVLLTLISTPRWEETPLASTLFFLIGIVMVGLATMGRLWCSIYISGYKDRVLISSGPYSLSRNPLYFFSAMGAVGLGLCTECLTIPVLISAAFAFAYPSVIRAEEAKLRAIYGDAFETYCRTVPRFFPRLAAPVEPETYTITPLIFRRRLIDSLWFVWGIGLIELIEELHEADLLPVLFRVF